MINLDKSIKVIICDLDGTLYQDERFYKRYISHIIKGTEYEGQEEILQEKIENILQGKDKFALGNFFKKDEVFKSSSLEERLDINPILNKEGDFKPYLDRNFNFSGDAWGAVFTVAHRLGLDNKKLDDAFVKVREEMITEEYSIDFFPELFEVLGKLKNYMSNMYMFTNTHEEAAIGFTKYLGLEDKFTVIKYGTDKPFGLMKMLPDIIKENNIEASQILAIGDHGYNDLYPIKELGGQTILVTPYEIKDNMEWSLRINTLEQLKEILEGILSYYKEFEEAVI